MNTQGKTELIPEDWREALCHRLTRGQSKEVAAAMGLDPTAIGKIARGKQRNTSVECLARLGEWLEGHGLIKPTENRQKLSAAVAPPTVVDIRGAGAVFHLLFPASSKVDIVMQPDGVRIASVHIDGRSVAVNESAEV